MDEKGKVLCAGIPRCGTTLAFRAMAGLPAGAKTPKDYDGPVIKTHSFRPGSFREVSKAIFLFGDPVSAVISTRENRYDQKHFKNCGAGDRDPETTDIYREDALNYGRMFRNWMRRQAFDLICVRYEALYDNLLAIQSFFEVPLYFPPPKLRRTVPHNVSAEDLGAIEETYAGLIRAVSVAPDVSIYRPTP